MRIDIDLTDAAKTEITRLCTITELDIPDLFRYSLSVFRLLVDNEGWPLKSIKMKDEENG